MKKIIRKNTESSIARWDKRTEKRLDKLYTDHGEVKRVLYLWKRTNHPEAEKRIREFEKLLQSIDNEILEIEAGKNQS